MRDGDKSKLRDEGILKAVVNIVDIVAHKLLGMDFLEQREIDKLLVETLDGPSTSGSERTSAPTQLSPFRRQSSVQVLRRVRYVSTRTSPKLTDKFMMPVLCFNLISGGSQAGSCLACPEFLIVPTGAGNASEDVTTDTEVYHTLKFGHQVDVRRDACNVGGETGFAPIVQLNNETLDFLTDSFGQDQGV